MATGTPRKPARKAATSAPGCEVTLSYPRKREAAEILRTPPAELMAVISTTSNKKLYYAENLTTLAALATDETVCGKVRLVYIDPPYATQTVFHSRKLIHAYEDVFEIAEYIEFMRERLVLLHHLLADDGSIYIHIDDKMLFHIKLLLDEIFGAKNFRNCITRKKCNPKNYTRRTYGNIADYILFYSKSDDYVWNRQSEAWTETRAKEYHYIESETGRRFMKVPIHAPGVRNGETGKPWRGVMPPPGKHWQFLPSKLDELDAKGEIFWSKNGNPRRKVYFDLSDGVPVQDIWMDFRDAHNQNIHITGYPTEKNVDLLKRIIEASSNPGDIVLDCFSGSGTTLVAADMLRRGWIGIDNSIEALKTTFHRFANGTEIMGDFVRRRAASKKVVEPSLFEVISDDADEGAAVLAQAHRVQGFGLFAETDKASEAADLVAPKIVPAKRRSAASAA